MSILPAPLRRSLSQARATWRDSQARAHLAIARLARGARLGAVAARLRPREVAVLHSGSDRQASGFFSEFAAVLGLLEHYERWRHLYAGVRIEFDAGLYYDAAFGRNWWEYYFEPIDIGGGDGAPAKAVSPHFHDLCANRVERGMSPETGAALIDRHIVVKPAITDMVDACVREQWRDQFVIGLHYRGTDKAQDAMRVPYPEVEAVVRDTMSRAGADRCRLFLATDEQAFVAYMQDRFQGQLFYREMFRSVDGRPIDVVNADRNHKKGQDALIDCLLLSRTHQLIRTASNLSLCSTMFNPRLAATLLNPEW